MTDILQITITPLGRSRFMARLGDRIILKSSRQPLLDAARVLVGEGVPPDTRIGMRHEGSPHVALSSTVGKASKLTVEETSATGPKFTRWKPSPFVEGPSPMRFGEEEAPGSHRRGKPLLGDTSSDTTS